MSEPIAAGVVVTLSTQRGEALAMLAKESIAILKALRAEATLTQDAPAEADFVLVLVDEASPVERLALPPLKDRAGIVAGVAQDVPACRAVIARARKRLRAHDATLGARELVFSPDDFGYLGLETDNLREKLEVLLTALVNDAERLRLRREGWEEPAE